MPNTNSHGPKRAILYARVSTDEQARSGYSLAQQLEALRAYAAREGYEVLGEVQDAGQSGASLERPGMDRGELRAKLAKLEEDREAAEREIAAIECRRERLERDRDAVMEHYASVVPGSLDGLSPEERHQIYKVLRLEVLAYPDKSLEVSSAILAGSAGEGSGEGPDVGTPSHH